MQGRNEWIWGKVQLRDENKKWKYRKFYTVHDNEINCYDCEIWEKCMKYENDCGNWIKYSVRWKWTMGKDDQGQREAESNQMENKCCMWPNSST